MKDKNEVVYVVHGTRRWVGENHNCDVCGTVFARRTNTKFIAKHCSVECSAQARRIKLIMPCKGCGVFFEVRPSRVKASKSGFLFCNRACKDEAQKIIYGIKEIQPSTYKDGLSDHKKRAFNFYGRNCMDCGISFSALLDVHHIDGNRKNNVVENLEVLCALHHAIRHLEWNEQKWIAKTSALTPRDRLEEVLQIIKTKG